MRTAKFRKRGLINKNECYKGDSIEVMLKKRMNGEEIEMGTKPLLYTEKNDGVIPEGNIRSDRFELAQDSIDYVEKTRKARRDAHAKEVANKTESNESTQGTQES